MNKKPAMITARTGKAAHQVFSTRTQIIVGLVGLIGVVVMTIGYTGAPQKMELVLIGFVLMFPCVIFGMRGTGGG